MKYTPLFKQPDASYYNHLLKQQTNKVQESKATVAACQERENTLRKELAETRRLIEQQENRIRDQDDEVGRLRLALIVAGLLLVGVSFVRFRK